MVHEGIFVAQAGDAEVPFVRLLLMELFGRENYVGTAMWRTHYSPKGGKETKDIAAIAESLVCFAFDKESLQRVALPVLPEGYSNPDGDPRNEWEARQKDAGRDTAKVTYSVPPYRWSLVKGRLPKGIWRVSPMSGVLWGIPENAGTFRFTVLVTDSEGKGTEEQLTLKVSASGEADAPADRVWWLRDPPKSTKSKPRITSDSLPRARVGKTYSAVLAATGGVPFSGSPRPGRGWAFGQATLEKSILEDRCYFGKKGTSIPETKKYLKDLPGGRKLINLTSWWDDVALSQDSTKHQNALREAGLIELPSSTAKPELLLLRLVDAFSSEGAVVLDLFSRSGDMAAVALKSGRRFVALHGDSDLEREFAWKCALPRLEAVVSGEELVRLPEQMGASEEKRGDFIRLSGRGGYKVLELGPAVATKYRGEEHPRLCLDQFTDDMELMKAVATAEGFLPADEAGERLRGVAWDGAREAIVLAPREFLDQSTASELASSARPGLSLIVYYFRSTDDFAPEKMTGDIVFRRIPGELAT
jgi:hypothetical protein